MLNVQGKWTLITGASRGIGLQIATKMADCGAPLILHSRNLAHTESLAAELRAKGVEVRCVAADLSDPAQVQRMLQEIDDMGVNVEIVFNDAGVQIAYRTEYLQTPVEDYTTSFLINTIAPMMICYHFLPLMKARGFGRIINTTSGIRLEPEQAGYSASKAALDKVTIDLGHTLQGTDVQINLADPGWCRTDLGGPRAPYSVESALPGMVVGAFVDDRASSRCFAAPLFHGLTLEEAVQKAAELPLLDA